MFPQYGMELWKSDGTAAGTVVVKDIFAGGLDLRPRDLTVVEQAGWILKDE
jgi:ELWxxDGT repeat protein